MSSLTDVSPHPRRKKPSMIAGVPRPGADGDNATAGEATTKGAQSLHRAMQLLAAVGERNLAGARLTELALATDLHIATAHRLLAALLREQMVSFDRDYTKRYFLGARLHHLIDLAPYARVRPRLRALAEAVAAQTGQVAYIYVPLLNDMMAIERAERPRASRILIRDIGRRLPMGVGAGSIAYLAQLPVARAHDLVQLNAERYAEFGGLSALEVWSSVEEARALGFGISRQQVAPGVIGIGMTIGRRDDQPEAAITVVGTPAQMTPERIAAMIPNMARIARGSPVHLPGFDRGQQETHE